MKKEIQTLLNELKSEKSKDLKIRNQAMNLKRFETAQRSQGKIDSFDFAIERLNEILKNSEV